MARTPGSSFASSSAIASSLTISGPSGFFRSGLFITIVATGPSTSTRIVLQARGSMVS